MHRKDDKHGTGMRHLPISEGSGMLPSVTHPHYHSLSQTRALSANTQVPNTVRHMQHRGHIRYPHSYPPSRPSWAGHWGHKNKSNFVPAFKEPSV